jgi:hypothetical protein
MIVGGLSRLAAVDLFIFENLIYFPDSNIQATDIGRNGQNWVGENDSGGDRAPSLHECGERLLAVGQSPASSADAQTSIESQSCALPKYQTLSNQEQFGHFAPMGIYGDVHEKFVAAE